MFHNASYSTGGGGVRATFFNSEGAKINDSLGPPCVRSPGYAPDIYSTVRNWTFIEFWRIIREFRYSKMLTALEFNSNCFTWSHNDTLRVRAFFHKTVRVCHLYCNFKIGFTCRITVIFGTLKDGSLLINTLASNIWFSYRNIFQNGVDVLPKIVDAFLSKSSNFHLLRIIR